MTCPLRMTRYAKWWLRVSVIHTSFSYGGQALWTQARNKGAKRIGPALVDEVRPAFVARRDSYYESRREELHQRGLDMAAVRVAAAYRGKAILPEPELEGRRGRRRSRPQLCGGCA